MLDYDDYRIETITIELRYEPVLAIWDKAGEIWTDVQSSFPELRFQNAMPNQQVFESDNATAVTELEAFRVSCRGVNAENSVVEIAQKLLQVCSDRLKVAVFTRVGFRDIRSRDFTSIDDANSAVNSLLPSALSQNLIGDSHISAINFGVRQERKTSGLLASIRTEERETKVTIPWAVRDHVTTDPSKRTVVVFDSDYYTVGTTLRETLDIREWSKHANRTIKRYWKAVLQ